MIKPAVLVVDDDPEVLRAIGRDLRGQYGSRYRVLQAESADAGFDALRQLQLRGEHLALFVVDQRMPRVTGVEFLERAIELFPKAKRALLTAYADTEAAISAINRAHIDHYLQKPWDPPEEKLYPVLTELLEDWEASFHPGFDGLRVVGHKWSPEAHRLKEFLARNHVPYRWLDVETAEAAKLLSDTGLQEAGLPLVLFQDGTYLERADLADVAERVGLRTRVEQTFYPLVIVGAGPAGLAAAVYATSEGVSTLLIEEEAPGGQAGQSSRIENYLGFPAGVPGGELARRAAAQARKFGAEILTPQCVRAVRVDGPFRQVVLDDGREISCHALLIATGVSYRRLDRPGIERLTGAGIYYGAAATEARDMKNQDVFVLGGGNSAGQAAIYLARFASRVGILVRGDTLADSMSRYLIDQIAQTPNIEVLTRTEIEEARGDTHLQELVLRNNEKNTVQTVPAAALFIFIGAVPRTDWLEGVIARDDYGFIRTGPALSESGTRPRSWPLNRDPYLLETSVPGIFAAGDVRMGSIKRVAAGVGEGAMVVSFVHQHLAGL